MQCSHLTKKKRGCTIDADRIRAGEWFCHVHDPEGIFAKQQEAKQAERRQRKAGLPSLNFGHSGPPIGVHSEDKYFPRDTPNLDAPLTLGPNNYRTLGRKDVEQEEDA